MMHHNTEFLPGDLVCFVPWKEEPRSSERGIVLYNNNGDYTVFWLVPGVRVQTFAHYLKLISRAAPHRNDGTI